eukprot:TRINITY_DN1600_c0_g2_i1.p1 TRINITY_DN1600_c0_g2~~TRINITY_DN1600_c0_g2_i1.p1  ORF type:complete len:162 (+),score=34.33 TRINITY_DN1600_c0_g2_i1:133-618(+)
MEDRGKNKEIDCEEDLDPIDLNNYKGIFYDNTEQKKYQDEITGAHFEYHDMIRRLGKLQQELRVPRPSNLKVPIQLPKTKERRNDVQQGYETIGTNYKSQIAHNRNARQFSSQFESLLKLKHSANANYKLNNSHEANHKPALNKKLIQIIAKSKRAGCYNT